MELKQTERKQAKIKLALQGISSSGKSMSALLIAKGLSKGNLSKVAVIDTENSIELYSHIGNFNVLKLVAPFSPQRYIQAIETCEKAGMEVIIIDSISHCWNYLLQAHAAMAGNSFTNWQKITPVHNGFVQRIMDSPCHVITTMRSKQDYLIQTLSGKTTIEKTGMKAIQRAGIEYDFTTVFNIGMNHQVKATKDRTGLFLDKPEFVITENTGKSILDWCNLSIHKEDVQTTDINTNNFKIINQNGSFKTNQQAS
jgi:hypothetical protein